MTPFEFYGLALPGAFLKINTGGLVLLLIKAKP